MPVSLWIFELMSVVSDTAGESHASVSMDLMTDGCGSGS